jgi:CheY-like chemotaxis protein
MRDAVQTIGNMIDKTTVSIISSVDEAGFPNTKAMLPPRKREGIKQLYFTTNTSSMRVKQYSANSKACVYFYDKRFFRGVMLKGTMSVLHDQQKVIDIEKYLNALPQVAPRLGEEAIVARPILWVDDHPENHTQIIEQLNNKDVSVIQEKTTEAALGRMATSKFDIVITDMHRVESGQAHNEAGMELIRTMHERNKTTPIIVFFGRSRRPVMPEQPKREKGK